MDSVNTFRIRIRKGEGVSKKGPMVVKHPSSSSSSSPGPATTTSTTTSSSAGIGHSKEIRSPVGPGPPSVMNCHRRRPNSPDPRHSRRQLLNEAPKGSPRSSPKSSPVRHLHRDRSNSPSSSRRVGAGRTPNYGGGTTRGLSRQAVITSSSPSSKRITPPTSPRVRRPLSPAHKLSSPLTPTKTPPPELFAKGRQIAVKCFATASQNSSSITQNLLPGATAGEGAATKRPVSPGSRPASPGSQRAASPRGTNSRGNSPRGRGASPGSRPPPISSEVLRGRVQRALKARLYLLHQPGPNSFSVGGDSPSHKYKVIIGPQTCSCGQGPYCIHVLFVMVRVLQLSESDPVLIAGSLKDYEVEQLLRAWEERRKKAIHAREKRTQGFLDAKEKFLGAGGSRGGRSSPSVPSASVHCRSETTNDDDNQCPICLMTMVEGESLVACEAGCRNFLHHHCMAVWAADRQAQGQPLLCPLCRAPWPSKSQPRINLTSRVTSSSNYGNYTHHDNYPSATVQPVYPKMSASFTGVCASIQDGLVSSSPIMSRSLSSAYPNLSQPGTCHSKTDSAYLPPNLSRSSVFGYPPTVRVEMSASFVRSASEEVVPLPRSDPIPAEHEETAAAWVYVFGRELIACLFSRDWAVRETGLRRLAHEVVKVLRWDCLVTTEQMQQKVVHCCANILAQVANDPVYKVYLACLRCFRVLLSHVCPAEEIEVSSFQELFRPLLHTLLLKCADGNRRTSQISIDSLIELSRGQRGELALGMQSTRAHSSSGLGGISYVLSCILDDAPPTEAPWQWLLGRLCVLDRLLDEFPHEFQLQIVELASAESGYKLQHYDRLMTVVEFAFKALGSNHATVSKLARRIYICGARMAAAEPAVFNQVCDMLAKLDVSLQMRLKRRLRSMQGERRGSLARLGDKLPLSSKEILPGSDSPRLVRSVSHSPSRMLSTLRSSSQSPARPGLLKASSKVNEILEKPLQISPPQRPNHLPLDSFDIKFKEKQAKLRQYHKIRAKNDIPVIVQQALISPCNKKKSPWLRKPTKLKGGLSHSYGDDLDLSPQTPAPTPTDTSPIFSFKDAVSTPATPSAPYSTPVKETFVKQMSQLSLDELADTPLTSIPGLDLVPKYLDDSANSCEQIKEGSHYEEGTDWLKGPLLGTGAFSSCYQARDVETGTIMAVKQLSICRNSEEEQERVEAAIEEEIIMMSKLRHMNIVRLLGATRVATAFSVFSEWMAGGSVAGMLDKYGAFSERVIVKYTNQILGGLSYLHDCMILHRDLKGANLLVDSTGQRLRIGDFGTAARLASKSTVNGEFQGQLLGTIAFMAPEVLRGDNYGRACDVWSVGCCIIEMATTKPPWGSDNVSNQYKLMFKIATSSGPPHVPETLSKGTRDLALQCLQIDSDLRPSVKELLRHAVFL